MSHFNNFVLFLLTPWFPALMITSLVIWAWFGKRREVPWILLGLCIYSSSLQKYSDEWIGDAPPLWGPLELAVRNGRPLTALCLFFTVFVTVLGKDAVHRLQVGPMFGLLTIQMVMLAKLLESGLVEIAVFNGLLVALVFTAFGAGISRNWEPSGMPIAIATALILFCGGFLCQKLLASESVMYDPGARLFVTTGDPQHAGVIVGFGLPVAVCFAWWFWQQGWRIRCVFAVFVGLVLAYILFKSGSRTAALMACVGLLVLFRRYSNIIVAACVLGGLVYFVAPDLLQFGADQGGALVRTNDSRSEVWARQWNTFLNFPILGKPLRAAGIVPMESSWLGLLEIAGLFGAIAGAALISSLVSTVKSLRQEVVDAPSLLRRELMFVILGGLIVGSFFEAYFMAFLSFPILTLYLIVSDEAASQAHAQGLAYQSIVEFQHHIAPISE